MALVGIVPAGGSGERLGADRPKAFAVCAGKPLIDWSLEVLEAVCDRVVVAAPADWLREGWVEGGASRSASVRNALAAAPEAYPDGTVARTLDRGRLWAVQTPQVFRADSLRRALDADDDALAAATDDASLVEAAGGSVRIVEGPPENFKVTTADDLARAEAALC
jgi:2-C-methyl-D-erythritol 4-phosphate cytidylyltransferase